MAPPDRRRNRPSLRRHLRGLKSPLTAERLPRSAHSWAPGQRPSTRRAVLRFGIGCWRWRRPAQLDVAALGGSGLDEAELAAHVERALVRHQDLNPRPAPTPRPFL